MPVTYQHTRPHPDARRTSLPDRTTLYALHGSTLVAARLPAPYERLAAPGARARSPRSSLRGLLAKLSRHGRGGGGTP
ncbi:hypothetical protein [Streptomyces sp. PU-14G]|uniref:hypothetical protein n=1 Tax=Streptomyces sp. PU-14G TaxID=2800808 RepID=UPI0034DEA365